MNVDFTGEQEEQAKELSFLSGALLMAVFLIFLILVSQFNSASTPFIILVTVVFSLIGVLLRFGHLPHGIRHHDDHDWYYIACGNCGEQCHCID